MALKPILLLPSLDLKPPPQKKSNVSKKSSGHTFLPFWLTTIQKCLQSRGYGEELTCAAPALSQSFCQLHVLFNITLTPSLPLTPSTCRTGRKSHHGNPICCLKLMQKSAAFPEAEERIYKEAMIY